MGLKFKDPKTKSFSRFEMDDNYVYAPIQKIAASDVIDQPVVNLSVDGNESYVAGNVTAHNCTDYCPEFALEETVEYDIAEYTRDRLVWSPERLAKRSEEHTSELQSLTNLVCRLLLEKKKKIK